jgi:hypothetical protein
VIGADEHEEVVPEARPLPRRRRAHSASATAGGAGRWGRAARRSCRPARDCVEQFDVGRTVRRMRFDEYSATCSAARPRPRTSMCHLGRACLDRNTAACPAELPPPTARPRASHIWLRAPRPSTRCRGPRSRRAAASSGGE